MKNKIISPFKFASDFLNIIKKNAKKYKVDETRLAVSMLQSMGCAVKVTHKRMKK